MTPLWTSAEIAAATGGTASGDFAATGVAFDSREVGPGDLFVALPGTLADGHRYVAQAMAAGASAAIVSEAVQFPRVLVPDTMAALEALGRAGRDRTQAKVVGVTGSVGKTGAKEALAAALARTPGTRVHRSIKSYNNHTGVPLSLARMPADSDYAVFEMGMNHAGEIAALTQQVRPHVALVTAVAAVHLEFFPSVDAIADAKGEIFQGLGEGGIAVIPFDSPWRDRLIGHAERENARILTFGSGDGADIRATRVIEEVDGTRASVTLPDCSLQLKIGQPGAHWLSNGLAVLAAVHALGADVGVAALALADLAALPGRGAQLRVPVADGGALLLDESYNANPTSMRATLAVLARATGRKGAVLGAMGELGPDSDALHAGLAEPVAAAGVGYAVLVGAAMAPLARALEARLEGAIEVRHVPDTAAARQALAAMLRAGDTVLVKGSNSVGLAALVAALRPDANCGEL